MVTTRCVCGCALGDCDCIVFWSIGLACHGGVAIVLYGVPDFKSIDDACRRRVAAARRCHSRYHRCHANVSPRRCDARLEVPVPVSESGKVPDPAPTTNTTQQAAASSPEVHGKYRPLICCTFAGCCVASLCCISYARTPAPPSWQALTPPRCGTRAPPVT